MHIILNVWPKDYRQRYEMTEWQKRSVIVENKCKAMNLSAPHTALWHFLEYEIRFLINGLCCSEEEIFHAAWARKEWREINHERQHIEGSAVVFLCPARLSVYSPPTPSPLLLTPSLPSPVTARYPHTRLIFPPLSIPIPCNTPHHIFRANI